MSALPPHLARRVDRLARRAHRFHRFAHHPLCGAYAAERVDLGPRLLLCRGCAFAAAGALVGIVAGVTLPVPPALALAAAFVVGVLAARRAVRAPRSPHRAGKLLTRAAPPLLAAALVCLGLRARGATGTVVSAATVGVVLLAGAAYRRRGPDRSPCQSCPERTAATTCSGFRRIARREAAFARVAGRLLRTASSHRDWPPVRGGVEG